MLKDLFFIEQVSIENAPRLYPKGIDWKIRPGINVIVGGTGLGKTTLVNAMLFAIFGELGRATKGRTVKVNPDFFRGRMVSKAAESNADSDPTVSVRAKFGRTSVAVARNLISGRLLKASLNGKALKPKDYEKEVAKALGLRDFSNEVLGLVDYLLYFAEQRYLLAWDSQIQNEVLNLLFGDPSTFQTIRKLWGDAVSSDSKFRNLRHQAVSMEKEIMALEEEARESGSVSIAAQRSEYQQATARARERHFQVLGRLQQESDHDKALSEKILVLQNQYDLLSEQIAAADKADLDLSLLRYELDTPSSMSTYYAITKLLHNVRKWSCPCCGKSTDAKHLSSHLKRVVKLLESGDCPICASALLHNGARPKESKGSHVNDIQAQLEEISSELQANLFEQEKTTSRLRALRKELERAEKDLEKAREEEWNFNTRHPLQLADGLESRRIALTQLRQNQSREEKRRDRLLSQFTKERDKTIDMFRKLYDEIAEEFAHHTGLFLDESCDVEYDPTGERARRPGPQLDPMHSAFYPVIDELPRYRPEDLSEAQRLFVDLAFRMTLVDVWHSRSKERATLIVETPEGSVDVAYMARVAEMLREFAREGHTLIITTNLNNHEFLPSLMQTTPRKERKQRILNLLKYGSPKKVQVDHSQKFEEILERTYIS